MDKQKRTLGRKAFAAISAVEGIQPGLDITSEFALLDVKKGRVSLASRIRKGEKFNVTLRGTITGVWGHNDGISQEFQVDVDGIFVSPAAEPPKKAISKAQRDRVRGLGTLDVPK